jgi:hypothetical protein
LPQNVIFLRNCQVFLVHPEYECVRYLVLTLVTVNNTVFWDVALCSVVDRGDHFGGTYCFWYLEGRGSTLLQNGSKFLPDRLL